MYGYFIPSESELPFFARHKICQRNRLLAIFHGGVKHVAIKRAQRGASYYKLKNGTLHAQHVAGHDIEIIDPTGAGDCFGATFITLSYPVSRHTRRCNMQMPAARSP
ncbi:hypothetical protein DMI70_10495 [Escherichia coli]|nr:hypothetical protein [Escherichia coli]